MAITVNVGPLSCYINNKRLVEVKGNTVTECLKDMAKQYPELELFDTKGNLLADIDVFVNGVLVSPKLMNSTVTDRDEIHIVLMICGG